MMKLKQLRQQLQKPYRGHKKRHDTWSAATAALGRTMIGTQLLATSLKGKEKITVQVNGDGPGGKIMAEANGLGQMKRLIFQIHM